MSHTRSWFVGFLSVVAALGCGGSADPEIGDEGTAGEAVVEHVHSEPGGMDHEAEPRGVDPEAEPDAIVGAFLDGLKQSDADAVASLLTDKAREAATSSNLLEPNGHPSMTYELQKVEYPKNKKRTAYVRGTWTQPGPDDKPTTQDVTFVLRKQDDGWRVAGVAVPLGEEEELQYVDFENPAEVLRKLEEQESETELARTPQSTVRQADHTDDVRKPARR